MARGTQAVVVDIDRLRQVRDYAEISQAELARRAHCSIGMVGMIEAGQRQPSYSLAERIAAALGCEITDFATVSDR